MTCNICDIIQKKKKTKKVYEDSIMYAFLAEKPSVVGHTIIASKKHDTIITQVEDEVLKKMFILGQHLSGILFEASKSEGTNILLQNGSVAGQVEPHFMMHIIPRSQGDKINFEWAQKKIPDEKMDEIQKMLELKPIEEKKIEPVIEKKEPEKMESKKENVLIKQLLRIP